VICVANKIDLDETVTRRRFSFPEKNDLPFFFVSASTGVNVVRFFNEAIRLAIDDLRNPKDKAMVELIQLIRPRTAA
jgi:Rab-like protein 2